MALGVKTQDLRKIYNSPPLMLGAAGPNRFYRKP